MSTPKPEPLTAPVVAYIGRLLATIEAKDAELAEAVNLLRQALGCVGICLDHGILPATPESGAISSPLYEAITTFLARHPEETHG